MYREQLYEHLNVLDGKIGYICITDSVWGLLGAFFGSLRALVGAFLCSYRRVKDERRKGVSVWKS